MILFVDVSNENVVLVVEWANDVDEVIKLASRVFVNFPDKDVVLVVELVAVVVMCFKISFVVVVDVLVEGVVLSVIKVVEVVDENAVLAGIKLTVSDDPALVISDGVLDNDFESGLFKVVDIEDGVVMVVEVEKILALSVMIDKNFVLFLAEVVDSVLVVTSVVNTEIIFEVVFVEFVTGLVKVVSLLNKLEVVDDFVVLAGVALVDEGIFCVLIVVVDVFGVDVFALVEIAAYELCEDLGTVVEQTHFCVPL